MVTQLQTLGKYHILERLASTPLAEIYKVKTVGIAGFEKVQVLKRAKPALSQDPKFVHAFIDQAKIAFSLNHRNIVQVFEFGKIDGELFLATEYIPGVNLGEVLQRCRHAQRKLPTGLVCYLMGEVAAGLEYAHRKTDQLSESLGVLHCDLSPSNIACSFEGSVKILDFGLSRASYETIGIPEPTRSLPRYLAPEQVQRLPVSEVSDVFSFGAILWELLVGEPLFAGETLEEVRDNILHAPIQPPRMANPEVPEPLDQVTMRCLERDAARRLHSTNDLQLELHRMQRQVGAVIGSRALSNFLQELIPSHADQDVRQQQPSFNPEMPQAPSEEQGRLRDLVAAAAELAEPLNPPALPAESESGRRSLPLSISRSPRPRFDPPEEARGAGVLRSSRLPEPDLELPRRELSDNQPSASGDVDPPPLPPVPEPQSLALLERSSIEIIDDQPEIIEELSASEAHAASPAHSKAAIIEERLTVDTSPEIDEAPAEPPLAGQPTSESAPSEFGEVSDTDDDAPSSLVDFENAEPTASVTNTTTGADPAPAEQSATGHDTDQSDRPPPAVLVETKRVIVVIAIFDCPIHLRDEALDLVENIAYKLDGLVHARRDAELVLLFGLPVGHENDIVSAVRFAFDAQEAVSMFVDDAVGSDSNGQAPAPSVRFGIRAGAARLSSLPSEEGYQLLDPSLEETRALAARAEPAEIRMAGSASRLAAPHYLLRELPWDDAGESGAICHRVLGPRTGARLPPVGQIDVLIGREIETKAMRSAWRDAVTRGEQRTLSITGNVGVGKTRLVDDFLAYHCSESLIVAAAATPHRSDTPYGVIADLLQGIANLGARRQPRSRSRLLAAIAEILANDSDADDMLEALKLVLDPGTAPRVESWSEVARARVYRGLRALLQRVAGHRPLVMVIEDLHWADSASREIVRTLIESPHETSGPLLLLATLRPEEDDDAAAILSTEHSSLIKLQEFDEGARQRLIVNLLGELATDQLVAEVERRAGGNPLFVHELCRAIREIGDAPTVDIPETVQGVIAGRVDALPAPLKMVLQHAAVIGPSFRESILARLISRNPARSLAELRNRGFLAPTVNITVPYGSTAGMSEKFERQWGFRHVVVQEVIYQSLDAADRDAIHRRVGELMARRAKRNMGDPPAEVARHLELGGKGSRASQYYLRAANDAAAAYANREAAELYDKALRLAPAEDSDLKYAAVLGRERIYGRVGLHDKQAEDLAVLRQLSGDDPHRLADLRTREAVRLLRLGEFYRALEAADEAEQAASAADDELLLGEALRLRGESYGRLDDHGRAVDSVGRALEIFEQLQAIPQQVRARLALGRLCLLQADYDEAFKHYNAALELIKRSSDRWHERILRNNLAVVHVCRGDFSQALDEAMYSLKLCQHFADRARVGDNASVIGVVYLELGAYDHARSYFEQALELHRETGSRWSEADTLVYAGLLERALGDYAHALKLLEQANLLAGGMNARYISINARSAIAATLCDRREPGDADAAARMAHEALEMAREARLVVREIPALSRAARATALTGNTEAARALSRRAVELLEEQKTIESAEEEIYYTHFRILDVLEDPRARDFLAHAHSGVMGKAAMIDDPTMRESYLEKVPLNIAIRHDYLAAAEVEPSD